MHSTLTRRAFLLGAGVVLLPLPAFGDEAAPWWHDFPAFVQTNDPEVFFRTGARMCIHGTPADPTWGPYAQRLTVLDQGESLVAMKRAGVRVITWIEGFGDCMLYAAAFDQESGGTFVMHPNDPATALVRRNHWNWTGVKDKPGNTLRWVGLHNTVNDEDFARPAYGRKARGVSMPTYPDGRPAVGWIEGVRYPLNARLYDACGAKDINGGLRPSFEPNAGANEKDPATGRPKGPVEGLYPAVPGRDDVPETPGRAPEEPVWCGVISVHKDLSAPFWREYARVSVREILRHGVDGVWCDNYSPWDNFGFPPLQKAFGDWSVHRFHAWARRLPEPERRHLGMEEPSFGVRARLKATAAAFGAKDPAKLDDPAWSDARWLDDPLWGAFKAFRQRQARADLKAFYDAIHDEARRAGRPDFCIAGNDVPFYGLGWTRDGWLDMISTELTPGWHMGAGTRGIGLPPRGKMAPVYRAAREHQKGPFVNAWYYLNQSAEKYQDNPAMAKVLMAEAFANGAFLMCHPEQSFVAGTTESHAWWNGFVRENARAFGRRVPCADVGLVFSPDCQLAQLAPGGFPDFDRQPHIFGHWGWGTALTDAHLPYRAVADWRLDARSLAGLRVLILPDVECLDEAAARVLARWTRAGGRLVATGPTGMREGPSGSFRPRARSVLADRFGSGLFSGDGPPVEKEMGKGRVLWDPAPLGMEYYLQADGRPVRLSGLRALAGPSPLADSRSLPTTVGLSLWQSPDGRALFADLVNYDLDVEADRIRPAADLAFEIALPAGWRDLKADTLSPDGTPPAVAEMRGNDRAVVRLPWLVHYMSVKLTEGTER